MCLRQNTRHSEYKACTGFGYLVKLYSDSVKYSKIVIYRFIQNTSVRCPIWLRNPWKKILQSVVAFGFSRRLFHSPVCPPWEADMKRHEQGYNLRPHTQPQPFTRTRAQHSRPLSWPCPRWPPGRPQALGRQASVTSREREGRKTRKTRRRDHTDSTPCLKTTFTCFPH